MRVEIDKPDGGVRKLGIPTVLDRVRCAFWRQWKTSRKRFAELVRRGVSEELAANTAGSRGSPWHVSQSPALGIALSNAALTLFGLPSLVEGR